ncbi:DUF1631 family protein [Pelagibaculum spongiae]|uniref:DUF1631 domain-containing protein n=1 Tax=Pelagibaculum spongiae TaxID=2080658 RepID=A0A2V1H441_9GAMM|nr:DUF1631 family protein [Pelagibaculum spongiae]PVZ71957.1 hypothetical protein DC094_02740 [Pelagibaculum spongiae]
MNDSSLGNARGRAVIDRMKDPVGQKLSGLLVHMLDQVDDALFELADRAVAGDQTIYFDAMREIRIRRKGLHTRFNQEVDQYFHLMTREPQVSETEVAAELDSLSLVKEDEMEEQLALTGMVERVVKISTNSMTVLDQRTAWLCSCSPDDCRSLSPKVIAEAFFESSRILELPIKARIVLYKLFEKHVMLQLPEFYHWLNQWLEQAGVLPDLTIDSMRKEAWQRRNAAVQASVQNTVNSAGQPLPELAEQAIIGGEMPPQQNMQPVMQQGQHNIMPAVQQLMASYRQGQGVNEPMPPQQAQIIPRDMLLNELTGLQTSQQMIAVQPSQLKEVIQNQIANNMPSANIGRFESDAIDLISMMFEFILSDSLLPDPIKSQVSRLQIPVVKAVIADPGFFSQHGHVSKKLINTMAHAGVGWHDDERGKRLLSFMTKQVDNILQRYQQDAGVFELAELELTDYLQNDQRRTELLEKRIREAEEGKARNQQAVEKNDKILKPLLSGALAEPVAKLLHHWQQVLKIDWLKHGDDPGGIWDKNCQEAALLSGLGKGLPINAGELGRLAEALKQGFMRNGLDEPEVRRLLKQIQQPLQIPQQACSANEALYQPADETTGLAADVIPQADLDEQVEDQSSQALLTEPAPMEQFIATSSAQGAEQAVSNAPVEPDMSSWLSMVDSFCRGQWFEWQDQDNKLRCKLAAVIGSSGRYIFVDRNGMKVRDNNRDELAQALQAQQLRLLDDAAMFDRALEAVIVNLREVGEKIG